MIAPPEVSQAAGDWVSLTRWERAELGRGLRRAGWTYGEIMDLLPVGKGTLAGWCKDIRLTEEQIEAIKARVPRAGKEFRSKTPIGKDELEIERIRDDARLEAANLMTDPIWLAGVVHVLGRRLQREEFVSSWPTPIPRALAILHSLGPHLPRPRCRIRSPIHLHDGTTMSPRLSVFWEHATGLHEASFHRTFVKPRGTGHRKNHLASWCLQSSGTQVRRHVEPIDGLDRDMASEVLGPSIGTIDPGR